VESRFVLQKQHSQTRPSENLQRKPQPRRVITALVMSETLVIMADVEDIEIILPLFMQYREFYERLPCPEESREYLLNRLRNNETVIFLNLVNGIAIGFALIYPSYNSLSLKPLYILHDLFVLPNFRGMGHGAILLETVKNYALSNNGGEIMLQTAKDNIIAQQVYENHGYIRDEEFYCYYKFLNKEE
jgi:ribosomal protein S18 acetylase RimI-like enzyme